MRARFEAFVKTLRGFEDIDRIIKTSEFPGKQQADYLLSGRSAIVELKTLENDPADKPGKFMEKLVDQGRFVFWGTLSTEAIFRKLPDGDELKKQLMASIGKNVEEIVRKADRQIRDTREVFDIPTAAGIVVILMRVRKRFFRIL